MQRTGAYLAGALLAQRGNLFHWVPVCLGIGIGLFFALRAEPGLGWLAGCFLFGLVAALASWRAGPVVQPLLLGLALICGGLVLAGWRAQSVAAPVLGWRYYGPVEGRIVGIDRSASDAVRLTLDRVRLDRVPPDRVPERVRISLHGPEGTEPRPGARVMTTAHLSPPGGPVEPGGFDFQRHSWFLRLGAVGYTRVPLMLLEPPNPREGVIFRWRMALSRAFQQGLPGETGAFAAAVTAGDRSGMGQETLATLRVSNLAHLLAISGLHMGLLAGFVFVAVRKGLALSQRATLYWPIKPMAAGAALVVATGYLLMAGGSIATERAYVMAAVALIAVMVLRKAISLRAVALAALIVLILRPEALLSPGFQMSFAATLALVAVFAGMRERDWRVAGWKGKVLTLVLSSAVAGAATAPVAAAHFNQIAHYGLLANLLSVPVMGTLVIPAALVAVIAMPFGLQALPLWVMGLGLDWILWVAARVSALEGARGTVRAPAPEVLPMLALGALVIVLWVGRWRWLGVLPILAAFWLWSQTTRPGVLIAESGGLVGVMTPDGRALSRERAQGFVATVWLENDGDRASQEVAAGRWPDGPVRHVTGKRAAAAAGPCPAGGVLVLNTAAELAPGTTGCRIYDLDSLRQSGAVALYATAEGWWEVTARQVTGRRYWSAPGQIPALQDQLREILPKTKAIPLAALQ
ncbi:ComEC/Rec2 family competence protein [Pseudooceanicola sp. HF7]|uniref:ComEC/Rec2 family competence protein n=1 Tax=Pseudooceanicola sp. HF7 TaxID=2721560 RepID=UPI0034C5C649